MRVSASIVLVGFILLQGCAPVFSSFQTARILQEGEAEVSTAFTSTYIVEKQFTGGSENEHAQYMAGARFASRITDVSELQVLYARLFQVDAGINVFGIGWKRSLVKDRMAFALPIGTVFGQGINGLFVETHPSIIFTIPLSESIEVNPSIVGVVPLHRTYNKGVAFNIGALINPSRGNWDIRPEIGLLKYPGEEDFFWAAGVAVGVRFKPETERK